MKILLHHEEAQAVVRAKCDDAVAYASGLTRVSFKAARTDREYSISAKGCCLS